MTGHLDIYTTNPTATVTLLHDNGLSFTAQAVDGHAMVGPFDLPNGNGATLTVGSFVCRGVLWVNLLNPVNGSASFAIDTFPFDAPKPTRVSQLPFTFEPGDKWGDVHTSLPPEQVLPTAPDRNWWLGNNWGVMLKDTPPMVPGANTTPREMVMSYFLHMYPREWQDKILTAHAERGFTHFHLLAGSSGPQDPFDYSPSSIKARLDLFKYVQSWGFFTSFWLAPANQRNWAQGSQQAMEPFLQALIAQTDPSRSILVMGKELDSLQVPGPTGLDDVINHVTAIANPMDLRVWLHFNANYPTWQPGNMTPVDWARQWKGRVVGLAWQAQHGMFPGQTASAGLMGARLWDARKIWAAADPSFLVSAWELVGLPQLGGLMSEVDGVRRAWAMVCATRVPGSGAPGVAGTMNGLWLPTGHTVL